MPRWRVLLALGALVGPTTGCQPEPIPAAEAPHVDAGWVMVPPTTLRQSGTLAHPRLAEASGAAVTTQRAGLLWTINDSGNAPDLLLIDTSGTLIATLPLSGVTNTDWEEVALGPCPTGRCLYIADTGDNLERRDAVSLLRLTEPVLDASFAGDRPARPAETLTFRYPDGAHDVEAMVVNAGGEVLLVTKGRSHGVLLFRVGASAWGKGIAMAERIDSLPIVANAGTGRLITGAALSPDGTTLMVRSYRDLFPFRVLPTGKLAPLGKPTACDILGKEPQGEGISWLNPTTMVLTSERGLMKSGTVFVVSCSV
ncbi:MAG: hypothetical protein IPP98_11270 [Gemmatimonadetes bacterium]|nr:hypothetical protein [Gemmatimonadota bacterium]